MTASRPIRPLIVSLPSRDGPVPGARCAWPVSSSTACGRIEPLERQPERPSPSSPGATCARVDRRRASVVVGVALEGRRRTGPRARAWMAAKRLRSAGRRTTCAQNSKKVDSQRSSRPRRRRRVRDHGLDRNPPGPGGGQRPLELETARFSASLVDARRRGPPWTRSSSTPRPSCSRRLCRDLVDRGGVEAALDEEPVGGRQDGFARALLLLGARHSHTAGIYIPAVSGMQAAA